MMPSMNSSWHANRYIWPGTGCSSINQRYRLSGAAATNGEPKSPNSRQQIQTEAEEPKTILVVEDTYENQFLANKFLTNAGYVVEIAENGIVAVEKFNKFQYDLILMDIYMPEMDGFEATEAIRKIEKQQGQKNRTPIIAFTAHAVEGYEEKCLQHDMDDFITKPIKKKDFLKAVGNWV